MLCLQFNQSNIVIAIKSFKTIIKKIKKLYFLFLNIVRLIKEKADKACTLNDDKFGSLFNMSLKL